MVSPLMLLSLRERVVQIDRLTNPSPEGRGLRAREVD
jgi:hypothetical protein